MDYLREIKEYNTRRADPRSGKAALLVIDMQNFFASIAGPIKANVRSLVERARGLKMPVIYTRHGHRDLARDGGMLAVWWGNDLCRYGSEEWRILEGIKPAEGEAVLDKTRYSAFNGTGLEEMLRAKGIEEVIITGVLTNCCCETTAREAFMRDFRVFFVADATATVNDDLHVATLKNLAFACAHIVPTEEVVRALG